VPYDPRYLEIERWSALTAASLRPFGEVASSTTEDDWEGWARSVKLLPALAPRFVPSPQGFQDWRAWALRLNEALYGLGL
jgi:hypothetical protein